MMRLTNSIDRLRRETKILLCTTLAIERISELDSDDAMDGAVFLLNQVTDELGAVGTTLNSLNDEIKAHPLHRAAKDLLAQLVDGPELTPETEEAIEALGAALGAEVSDGR